MVSKITSSVLNLARTKFREFCGFRSFPQNIRAKYYKISHPQYLNPREKSLKKYQKMKIESIK